MLDLLVSVSASRYSPQMSAPLMTLAGYGPMPWEAAATMIGAGATLVTGILAVIAAVIIGIRQSRIANNQASIAAHQSKTDEMRLRSELFERRLSVYVRLRNHLNRNVLDNFDTTDETTSNYFSILDDGRFIFSAKIATFLRELTHEIIELSQAQEANAVAANSSDECLERLDRCLNVIIARRDAMHDLFDDEIRLDRVLSKS